jgi:hypothetical protein
MVLVALAAGAARGATYKLANGEELVGEALPTSANEQGVQVKVGEGDFKQVPWAGFSQDDLKRFAGNPKIEPFVEPFIEVTTQEKIARTEVNIKDPPRLDLPPHRSLLVAMFSSGLGLFLLLLLYAANIYAGFEVAIFRARPVGLVCGVSAALPLAGPIIFLSMKTRTEAAAEGAVAAPAEGEAGAAAAAGAPVPAGADEDDVNPMRATGAAHPGTLKVHHDSEEQKKPALPPATTFQRGQFTFNRRFFETKFPGFFGVVRRDADKDMVLVIKCARGEYAGQRISRIAANDLHLQVQRGPASEEVMIPFQEIQQIQLRHKDAT